MQFLEFRKGKIFLPCLSRLLIPSRAENQLANPISTMQIDFSPITAEHIPDVTQKV